DTSFITAWYTTEIPVSASPGADFGGQLPGLILELEMNGGQVVYKAAEVSPKVKLADIKEPKGGKKVTAGELAKEREKMFEEMRRNMPNGGQLRIMGQ
ncbi:MAG: GLPGLI family protein, partial [Flavisolibacter sp.]|nr:GLPGLI family protein [Flavisolibacter sp.]